MSDNIFIEQVKPFTSPSIGTGAWAKISYQNSAMSASVDVYAMYGAGTTEADIIRIYEPLRNNDVSRYQFAYAETIDKFPFDNQDWNSNRFKDAKLIGIDASVKIKGCIIGSENDNEDMNYTILDTLGANVVLSGCNISGSLNNIGAGTIIIRTNVASAAIINGTSKTNVLIRDTNIHQRAFLATYKDNSTILELTLHPTSQIAAGDQVEAVTLFASASCIGDANEFFASITRTNISSNMTIKPSVSDSFFINKTTIGSVGVLTIAGNIQGCTIGDDVFGTITGDKSNVQIFKMGADVYELGVTAGNVTATLVT